LTIDVAGELTHLDGSRAFVVGRDADLVVDDNPYLHRRFLEFRRHHDIWWVANVGGQITATVEEPGRSVQAWLAPGGRVPIVNGTTTIRFTAGPTTYELLVTVDETPSDFAASQYDDDDDGTETLGRIRLTDDQRLMLVVLAESALRHGMHRMSDLPSAATAATRLGWTQKKFEKKIDNVCDRLARLDVRGLKGDLGSQAVSRRVRLVQYAVSTRMVTAEDLAVLDAIDADRAAP
jgi:hypothetical protein